MTTQDIIVGDALKSLRAMASGSVQTCVTSPPYFGLRDYGTGRWEGGVRLCDHTMPPLGGTGRSTLKMDRRPLDKMGHSPSQLITRIVQYRDVCKKCGAIRVDEQIGMEKTPALYVTKMVEVFGEVRRVLRDDGTLWLNIGDSYQCAKGQAGGIDPKQPARRHELRPQDTGIEGLKPKDLIGIPWMVAFALRADGWWLRQDIIWSKGNPMPSSVKDRCTTSHEYLFLLAKNKKYHFDAAAISEKATYAGKGRGGSTSRYEQNTAGMDNKKYDRRNKRSVWTINPQPFKGAHFAVMPEALVEPCIKAGCPRGGLVLDPFCGSGTVGVVAKRLGRNFVGLELNAEYTEIARNRIAGRGVKKTEEKPNKKRGFFR